MFMIEAHFSDSAHDWHLQWLLQTVEADSVSLPRSEPCKKTIGHLTPKPTLQLLSCWFPHPPNKREQTIGARNDFNTLQGTQRPYPLNLNVGAVVKFLLCPPAIERELRMRPCSDSPAIKHAYLYKIPTRLLATIVSDSDAMGSVAYLIVVGASRTPR